MNDWLPWGDPKKDWRDRDAREDFWASLFVWCVIVGAVIAIFWAISVQGPIF